MDVRLAFGNAEQVADAQQAIKAGVQMGRAFIAKTREEMLKKVLGDGKPGTLDDLPEAAGVTDAGA